MTYPDDPAAGAGPTPPASTPVAAPPPPAGQPGAAAPQAAPAGPNAGAALNEAMATLTSRFSTPELLAGGGGLLVLAVFVLFGAVLGTYWPGDVVVATSALLLLVVVGQRMGWIDFGTGQRTLIVVLGFVMGVMLIDGLVLYLRISSLGRGDATFWIGLILTWIGEAAAAAGAFLTIKARRA